MQVLERPLRRHLVRPWGRNSVNLPEDGMGGGLPEPKSVVESYTKAEGWPKRSSAAVGLPLSCCRTRQRPEQGGWEMRTGSQ